MKPRQKYALAILPVPILIIILSKAGWLDSDLAFWGAFALLATAQIAFFIIKRLFPRNG